MPRVCIIGAGPSGLSVIYQILRLKREKPAACIDFVCYEKHSDFGGLWNYSWRTGTDEFGNAVHASMYRNLWSNGPKEASLEYPDYTFLQHFGKPISSFPPREVLLDYIKGRYNQYNIGDLIEYRRMVLSVTYSEAASQFLVSVKDLVADKVMPEQKFDFVINCSGHFSVPNVPPFPGIGSFGGRVLHSHDFRSADEFKDKCVLVIGSSYSAEDLCLQTMKFGAKSAICSYRTKAPGFKWPWGIQERPLVTGIQGHTVTFADGSQAECDAIILCTGYKHHYPYLEDSLRLNGPNELYPDNLYKGTVWTKGGGGRMLYVGVQDQYYTFTMFDAQARWAVKYISGDVTMPADEAAVTRDIASWRQRQRKIAGWRDAINFQAEFVNDLAQEADYGADLDVADLFHKWEEHKYDDLVTYRDQQHASKYSGTLSPVHHTPWREAMDDSKAVFLADS